MPFGRRLRIKSENALTKYGVRKAEAGRQSSAGQELRSRDLQQAAKAGYIKDLVLDPVTVVVSPEGCGKISFTPDFRYTDHDGVPVVEDYKGAMTGDVPTRLKLFRWKFPEVRIRLTKWKGKRLIEVTYEPGEVFDTMRKMHQTPGWDRAQRSVRVRRPAGVAARA